MDKRLSTVFLKVANMDNVVNFYTNIIGLKVLNRDDATVNLGVSASETLLSLRHEPDFKRYRGAGLYHVALLLPTRADLARAFKHYIEQGDGLQGASDHYVSEAIYLSDPEGNGVEVYADRPRDRWTPNGQIHMTTEALNAQSLMAELDGQSAEFTGLPAGTKMGHVHLHVHNIPQAADFYQNILGMDLVFNLGSALFLSYEGYHHHLGANIWNGTTIPPADALGLDHYTLYVTSEQEKSILDNAQKGNIPIQEVEDGFILTDPSNNQFLVSVQN